MMRMMTVVIVPNTDDDDDEENYDQEIEGEEIKKKLMTLEWSREMKRKEKKYLNWLKEEKKMN